MQPPNDRYLSAFNQPLDSTKSENKISAITVNPKEFGRKILAGFGILLLIWCGELFVDIWEYQALTSEDNGQELEPEYSFCDSGDDDDYDFEQCIYQLEKDAHDAQVDAKGFDIFITSLKIVGWLIVISGLMDICSLINFREKQRQVP